LLLANGGRKRRPLRPPPLAPTGLPAPGHAENIGREVERILSLPKGGGRFLVKDP